ncbi:hypothetical protein [Actinomadura oligospora]|uniref:hypothetical protein n=1 Tax=Actinomadura oligospora TaxID=111804 RepID=UPI00047AA3C0|nr:hypothetical protein [Actinomadura oligospora]
MPSPRSARLTTRFLIASATPQIPGSSALRALLPELTADRELPVRAGRFLEADDPPLLGPPLPAPSAWTERLRACAGPEPDVARVLDARYHRLIETSPSVAMVPDDLRAVRLLARTVATAIRGALVDLDSGQVLAAEPEPSGFVLGHGWVGVLISPDGEGMIRADTAGLHRFGLPEVFARFVPLGYIHLAANLVRGLAYRLATVHHPTLRAPDDEPSATSPSISLTRCATSDVLRFWGLPGASGPSVIVRLIPASISCCPGCQSALEAIPPTPTPASEWWRTQAAALPPHPHPSPPYRPVPLPALRTTASGRR